MRAAVYLRVSTDRQDEANQEPDCLRLCQARGWDPVIFRETESGAKRRPIWESVKRAANKGEVGAVVVWAMDRAGRDRVVVSADFRELAHKSVRLASVRESWLDQPPGPTQALLIEMFGWFAESERNRLRERTSAALAQRREQIAASGGFVAKKSGRWTTGLGRRQTDPEVVGKMRGLWMIGRGPGFVAREMGLPKSTVRTWFGRFAGGAKKGSAGAVDKTAENQGQ